MAIGKGKSSSTVVIGRRKINDLPSRCDVALDEAYHIHNEVAVID